MVNIEATTVKRMLKAKISSLVLCSDPIQVMSVCLFSVPPTHIDLRQVPEGES